ncbi:diacylglycerol kinase [Colwellia psychrerythraea]|uniref:Diacylglycerol kinase n=1 Tax=Colwellia psychrerythraea TaxID=28229 RepID=A0A099KQY6_COLPS|nr:diacylglycerol kinase [Colwellia psychrerythraea]KGJ92068.1 diacylglycerol kinase [Colwellia psychrerythraea]
MNTDKNKSTDTINKPNGMGLSRILKATRCSMLGIQAAYKHESAFRQELCLCLLLLPVSLFIANSGMQLALLIGSLILLLLVEVINSAIEAVVDRIGLEHHELSGRAKDLGSAAVFLAIVIGMVIWAGVIFDNYFS